MKGRAWQVGVSVGLGVVLVGLVVAFVLGLLLEAAILLATVGVCALSLLPLVVDRRGRLRSDEPTGRPWPIRSVS